MFQLYNGPLTYGMVYGCVSHHIFQLCGQDHKIPGDLLLTP